MTSNKTYTHAFTESGALLLHPAGSHLLFIVVDECNTPNGQIVVSRRIHSAIVGALFEVAYEADATFSMAELTSGPVLGATIWIRFPNGLRAVFAEDYDLEQLRPWMFQHSVALLVSENCLWPCGLDADFVAKSVGRLGTTCRARSSWPNGYPPEATVLEVAHDILDQNSTKGGRS
ncbi:hypothetical protein [Actomonas aquatica]|uniref:Uncharacterized protein n=1 Tax=Actomonas aquatica TaxID=2866162 RepID=A0ABZ1C9H0_9BACT|nr:hypothetical protein [Opitutus sp. WL0086]WRQ88052.1 hypothetical protein K1X11_001450 [Opitutus sp. WL0086]